MSVVVQSLSNSMYILESRGYKVTKLLPGGMCEMSMQRKQSFENDDDYGDYLHEQRKDRNLDEEDEERRKQQKASDSTLSKQSMYPGSKSRYLKHED